MSPVSVAPGVPVSQIPMVPMPLCPVVPEPQMSLSPGDRDSPMSLGPDVPVSLSPVPGVRVPGEPGQAGREAGRNSQLEEGGSGVLLLGAWELLRTCSSTRTHRIVMLVAEIIKLMDQLISGADNYIKGLNTLVEYCRIKPLLLRWIQQPWGENEASLGPPRCPGAQNTQHDTGGPREVGKRVINGVIN